ncbi:pirin family protein [Novosphingobium sp.]|uniref:pirin family protein n=1 Tax=Novosphingobium sp. TaxID=1874826 RepID=UPI0025E328EF|nr:pirin family protein [Novosphingobium sp.]MCC6926001.1 pirin family protein [Novosphingobium sp.]
MSGAILRTVTPVQHDLGGMYVRRALPAPGVGMVGPFIFVDQFGPAEFIAGSGMAITPHPHAGLSTVTWLFDGAIHHRDSLGTSALIRPGQVNLMTAGKGITHSERSPEDLHGQRQRVWGIQTWLALPDELEDMHPAFEQVADLPVIEERGARATVIMGTLWGMRAATTCHAPTIYADIALEPGGEIPINPDATERAVMLVNGGASLDGQPLRPYDLNLLDAGDQLRLTSDHGGRVMLLGGEPLYTPRYIWWNFVSSSPERIRQWTRDWQDGKFPPVPGDPDN